MESQITMPRPQTIAQAVKEFNRELQLSVPLPSGLALLNPFSESLEVLSRADAFYDRFYADSRKRRLILGINPGRLGAGQTGVPFTDPRKLYQLLGAQSSENLAIESSSTFVYRMIEAFGGVEPFYEQFLISSLCPLGFVKEKNGRMVNFNYYDSDELLKAVIPFMVECMEKQLCWPIDRKVVFCLGTGKNLRFLSQLNQEYGWFEKIIALEHPRYIMQYKSREEGVYISKYLEVLGGA